MAKKSTLYLNTALQKEMEKRPNGVGDQLERLFDCYKYCRRQIEGKFEDAELDLLLYAQKYGEWDDDPKALYGLGMAIQKALDDRLDVLEPNGAAKNTAKKVQNDFVEDTISGEFDAETIKSKCEAAKEALIAARKVLDDTNANQTPFSEERLEEIQVWAEAIYDNLDEDTDIGYMMIFKLKNLHIQTGFESPEQSADPFYLLTLVDALEQANKTENPQRTIRYLLPGWGERALEVVRTQKSLGVEGTTRWLESVEDKE